MGYPTPGRRRQRTGGITVAELVDRQRPTPTTTGAVGTMPPAPDEHGEPGTVALAEVMPAAPERGTSTMARAGRIAGLCVGVLAVFGAVTAAWAVNDEQKAQPPVAAPYLEIAGVNALRLDSLAARLGDRGAGPVGAAQTPRIGSTENKDTNSKDTNSKNTESKDKPTNRPPRHGASTRKHPVSTSGEDTRRSDVPSDSQRSPEGVVRRFYRLLATDPDRAVRQLDPELAGTDAESLVRSWSGTRRVTVDQLTTSEDGTVTAVVRIQRPDGSWLRVRQLFRTTNGELPLIDSVRVLSAQRG